MNAFSLLSDLVEADDEVGVDVGEARDEEVDQDRVTRGLPETLPRSGGVGGAARGKKFA